MILNRLKNTLLVAVFLTVVSVEGCSVLEPIGNVFVSGYQEFTSYFNAYYNASRLFKEAETEVLAATRDAREKQGPSIVVQKVVVTIQQSTKNKFNQVIDKCSYILTFYPRSSIVDNALFLIGKSYFYQEDYVKAERKFTEMISQYPTSSLVLDAHHWLLRTVIRLKKYDEAIQVGLALINDATVNGEEEIVAHTYRFLGEVYEAQNEQEKALEYYEKASSISEDDELRANCQTRVADIYFSKMNYAKAVEQYLKVLEYSPDVYTEYYASVQASESMRQQGEFDRAMRLNEAMLNNYRFYQYLGGIRYERGLLLMARGDADEAFNEFTYTDTTYARTEGGYKAAYQIARIYEQTRGNYLKARQYYQKAAPSIDMIIGRESRLREIAFSRYFDASNRFHKADSLYGAAKEQQLHPEWFEIDTVAAVDSVHASSNSKDSIHTSTSQQDTARRFVTKRDSTKKILMKWNADSLKKVVAGLEYELGGIFYSDLDIPDSAIAHYQSSLSLDKDSIKTPRTYFIMAEIIRKYPAQNYGNIDELYKKIVADYPHSPFAPVARKTLGMPEEMRKEDPAELLYKTAEQALFGGDCQQAIRTYRKIIAGYPNSALAPKSQYALAYAYEHCLAQPESALVNYKRTVDVFGTTSFATAARLRIPPPVPVIPDSIKARRDSTMSLRDSTGIARDSLGRLTTPSAEQPKPKANGNDSESKPKDPALDEREKIRKKTPE
jgi:tetratricopeptide (TPR) repeat protein